MFARRGAYAIVLSLAAASPTLAADVSQDGARALQDTFERYLGKPAAGQAAIVSVSPAGAAYSVSIDLRRLMAPLAPFGLQVGPMTFGFHTAPQPDGTWRMSDVSYPANLSIQAGDQTTTYSFQDVQYEGIFDPTMAGFLQGKGKFGRVTANSTTPKVNISVSYADNTFEQTGRKVGEGIHSSTFHQTIGPFMEKVEANIGGDTQATSLAFTLKMASGVLDVDADSIRAARGLDLWAFVVANAPKFEAQGAVEGLKSRLLALLPVFQSFKETGKLSDLGIDTGIGTFAAKEFRIEVSGTGAVPASEFAFKLGASGLSMPDNLLPAWQRPLVPTDFDIAAKLTGFDLDRGARALIAAIDPANPRFIASDAEPAIREAFREGGPLKLSIPAGAITTSALQIAFQGEFTFAEPRPSLNFDVTAKGLDAAIGRLRTADPAAPLAAQAVAMLEMARSMGKPAADGALTWHLELSDNGSVLVNGAPVPGPR